MEQEKLILDIDVTQEDIDEGKPQSPSFCPIARAANRALRDVARNSVLEVSVSTRELRLYFPEKRTSFYDTRRLAYEGQHNQRAFVVKFDCDGDRSDLLPFKFQVELFKQGVI